MPNIDLAQKAVSSWGSYQRPSAGSEGRGWSHGSARPRAPGPSQWSQPSSGGASSSSYGMPPPFYNAPPPPGTGNGQEGNNGWGWQTGSGPVPPPPPSNQPYWGGAQGGWPQGKVML